MRSKTIWPIAVLLAVAMTLGLAGLPPAGPASAETGDPGAGVGAADPFAGIDPVLLRRAQGGDPQAAYEVGLALSASGDDAVLRAAVPLLGASIAAFEARSGFGRWMAVEAGYTLAYVQLTLNDYDAALATADRLIALATELRAKSGSELWIGEGYTLRGLILNYMSRYPESLEMFARGRAILEGENASGVSYPANIASNWMDTGMSLEAMGRFDEALAAYQTARAGFEATMGRDTGPYGHVLANIGWLFVRMKRFDEAEDYITRAHAYVVASDGSFSLNATSSRINLGLVALEQGRTDDAIRWVMQAMPWITANRVQSLSNQRWAFELLQRAFAKKGEIDRAILFGKMAVNAQQEIRALNDTLSEKETAGLRDEWRRLYEELADLLIGQGRISEAQAVLNMEKEQEVFDYLKRDSSADLRKTQALLSDSELGEQARLAALAEIPVAAEQELQRLYALDDAGTASESDRDRIAVLEDALQQATDQFDAAVAGFLAEVSADARGSFEAQFDSVGSYQDILAELERPTAILQIAALDDATHLFLTLPGISRHHEVAVGRAELARLVFAALQAIEDRDPDVKVPLRRLDDILIAPVRDELQAAGVEVVMLNLDGFLRYVPFAALYDGRHYLVEDYALAIYSAAVPTQFRHMDRDAAKSAGFGVTRAYPGFDALPGVKFEIERIFGAGILAGAAGLDDAFDEASLKRSLRGKPEILHIASHFALKPGQEDDSFLLLGDGAHLTLAEIRRERALRFQGVDLLTLSACQTARGGDGSELDGFAATAQLSGASAVMASLWPVADAATPRLMALFYAGMVGEGLDKAEALRQAQLTMLHHPETGGGDGERAGKSVRRGGSGARVGLDHPYYWSAFVLMGNWL